MWGLLTSYWRTRGTFNITPSDPYPFYDLSIELPTLRPRTWTLNQIVQEIQYMLLENPSGISGAGMSQQISIGNILNAVSDGLNRFLLDAHFPISIHEEFGNPPPPTGMIQFSQNTVFVHRAAWRDVPGGIWANLWRQDSWASDWNNTQWTIEPGPPSVYSEAENAPLMLQLVPPPINEGVLEALTVDSNVINLGVGSSLLGIPDEWIPAVKYAALSQILSADSQINDPLRAQYAETRYGQLMDFAKNAKSIIRALCNNLPLQLDPLASIDMGYPTWRNQIGPPINGGVLYDIMSINPGTPDQTYGIAADVVQAAPIPLGSNNYIPVGEEQIDSIKSYAVHILTFKCGGNEFKSTMSGHDAFMKAVATRKGVNAAKIKYLEPIFGQYQREEALRPDIMEMPNA